MVAVHGAFALTHPRPAAAHEWRHYLRLAAATIAEASSDPLRRQIASRMLSLTRLGWTLLTDARWPNPGTPAILVGPPGIFPVAIRGASATALADGDESDEGSLIRFSDLVEEAVAGDGVAPSAITPVIAAAVAEPARGDSGLARHGRARRLTPRRLLPGLLELPPRLMPEVTPALVARLSSAFPSYRQISLTTNLAEPLPPEPPGLAAEGEEIAAALLRAAQAEPVEQWLTFLHPDQLALVRRHFGGPARISGPPGTGKTLVGLHRAAVLAQRTGGRVLYTSAAGPLAQVQANAFRRLAPSLADRVEFTTLPEWALRLLRERGHQVHLDAQDECFIAAWEEHSGVLRQVEADPAYWRDEITYLIKGRGITELEAYLTSPRPGRRVALQRQHRHAVWELYEAYEGIKKQRELVDAGDLVIEALAEICREPIGLAYDAVIADEVQDLTVMAVRLLHELGGDRPDGLLLIGDRQQSVSPVGLQLAEAQLTIRGGRSETLRRNYRNSSAILAAAMAVAAHDLDDDEEPGAHSAEAMVPGGQVVNVVTRSAAELDRALLGVLRDLAEVRRHGLSGVTVLCATDAAVRHYVALLAQAGIPVQSLDDYASAPADAVTVATIRRGKGLEFPVVLLPRFNEPIDEARTAALAADRIGLANRQLYLGMTRANELLWLGQTRQAT